MDRTYLEHYRDQGYAVVRGMLAPAEVAEIADAFDRVYAQGLRHPTSFRHQNVLFRIAADPRLGRIVRMVQWPAYFEPVLGRYRTDPRMLAILEPLLGRDLKQIINQMHWKPAGAGGVEFGYHQDICFRRPRAAYRDPANSYVQTGLAVDPHGDANGAMTVLPGSHKLGELGFEGAGRIMDRAVDDDDLRALGLDPAAKVGLVLEPGDLALWHLNLIHGSGLNRSAGARRFYLNGYVTAANCDRGEWAFRAGQPCPLGEPVLVHYEDLHRRPEPHYLES
jgi:ectoine hydroxylase-related dioxygenase (phytanoyl-CoA dioxygenase family)